MYFDTDQPMVGEHLPPIFGRQGLSKSFMDDVVNQTSLVL